MPSEKSKVVLIAGGGTGGHIYPGLAVAQALKQKDNQVEIHFIGTKQGLENRIIPQHNYSLHLLSISGLNGLGTIQKLITLSKFPLAFFQTLYLLLKLKPKFVFGVGGYASGPVVLIASLLGYPTALFESNAIPGITNRILSKFVKTSFSLFEESKKYLKSQNILFFGFPVRGQMQACPPRENSDKLRVLIFGGSQGARGINKTVSKALVSFNKDFKNIEFIHQTGKADFHEIESKYKDIKNVKVLEYLDPIKDYYDWADVIFCRAGASTISELSACGKAAVLVPFPFAADDHQKKNAQSLAKKNAALYIEQEEFTKERFLTLIDFFKKNKNEITKLEKNISTLYKKDAAAKIADYIAEKI